MSLIKLKGSPVNTYGELPSVGTKAADFTLVKSDLSETGLSEYSGKKIVLNIFPSLDTSVCATSVRRFNAEAVKRDDVVVLCISADLPFAHERFCGAEGLKNVITLSTFRNSDFGKDYSVVMIDGPLKGLLSRAVIVLDEEGKVKYSEQVADIIQEPDYEVAINSLD